MGSTVPIQLARYRLSQWAARHTGTVDLVVASIVGLVMLPPIFQSMRTYDIHLGERVSLVSSLWLVLAIIANVVILRARSEVVRDSDSTTARLLDLIPTGGQALPATSTTMEASPESLRLRGIIVVHAMIDLILLFILQAIVRQPFVGLIGPQVSPGIVDGAFVGVVVLVAISVLIRLRGASRLLIERLAIAGLDRVVPTAGFTSGSTAATKPAIVSVVPNLVALVVLSFMAPLLESLPNPQLPVFRSLTLDWPVTLIVAMLEVALLVGMRWQIVGFATRLMGSVIDSLDRLTRQDAGIGTDAGRPMQVRKWRNAALSIAEGLVHLAYLFVVYQLIAVPLTKTLALPIDSGLEDLIATVVTALTLLFAAVIVLRVYRAAGPIVGVCAIAGGWALISALPLIDRKVLGTVSLQWSIKLVVGLGVLAAFLAVRGRVQQSVRETLVPLATRPMRSSQRGATPEQIANGRRQAESTLDGLVDLLYLVIGSALVVVPLHNVLIGIASPTAIAAIVTVGVNVIAAYLVNRIRATSGVVAATLGLVLVSPTLLGLPLLSPNLFGSSSSQWVARVVLGLGLLALLLGVRSLVQAAGRSSIVPPVSRQLATLRPTTSEAEEAARRQSLGRSSDSVVDLGYLVVGYIAVVAPITAAFASTSDLRSASTVIGILFLAVVAYVLYQLVRSFGPKGPGATMPPSSQTSPTVAQ